MRFSTLHQLSVGDLHAMAGGILEDTVTDIDFLETLAARKCLLVPPWILRADPDGGLARIAPLIYTIGGKLDKPRILLAVARCLRRASLQNRFGRQLAF